ncbi:hypothetical protein L1987_65369 [Smallanthus sonchifolius]|uniref:Uncharacterized protein n=1 Tax=Smallanthus sonchifolius TaxID=185202 RepID=A0ACB9BUA6_9ASTR|nr:hypothetical protein L1987_65369 [Smallanthus sonchifolius]
MLAHRQHSNLISDHKFRQAYGAIGEVVGVGVRELRNASEQLGRRKREVIRLAGCNGVGEPGASSGGVDADEANYETQDDEEADEDNEFGVEIEGVVVRRWFRLRGCG